MQDLPQTYLKVYKEYSWPTSISSRPNSFGALVTDTGIFVLNKEPAAYNSLWSFHGWTQWRFLKQMTLMCLTMFYVMYMCIWCRLHRKNVILSIWNMAKPRSSVSSVPSRNAFPVVVWVGCVMLVVMQMTQLGKKAADSSFAISKK